MICCNRSYSNCNRNPSKVIILWSQMMTSHENLQSWALRLACKIIVHLCWPACIVYPQWVQFVIKPDQCHICIIWNLPNATLLMCLSWQIWKSIIICTRHLKQNPKWPSCFTSPMAILCIPRQVPRWMNVPLLRRTYMTQDVQQEQTKTQFAFILQSYIGLFIHLHIFAWTASGGNGKLTSETSMWAIKARHTCARPSITTGLSPIPYGPYPTTICSQKRKWSPSF